MAFEVYESDECELIGEKMKEICELIGEKMKEICDQLLFISVHELIEARGPMVWMEDCKQLSDLTTLCMEDCKQFSDLTTLPSLPNLITPPWPLNIPICFAYLNGFDGIIEALVQFSGFSEWFGVLEDSHKVILEHELLAVDRYQVKYIDEATMHTATLLLEENRALIYVSGPKGEPLSVYKSENVKGMKMDFNYKKFSAMFSQVSVTLGNKYGSNDGFYFHIEGSWPDKTIVVKKELKDSSKITAKNIIEHGAPPCLLTHNHEKSINKEACWTNITAGNRVQIQGDDQSDEYYMNVMGNEPVSVIKEELEKRKWYHDYIWKSITDKFYEMGRVIEDGKEEFHFYHIFKHLDESFSFEDYFGKSCFKLLPANSRYYRKLEGHDASNTLNFTFQEKKFTLHNRWIATGPTGNLFKIYNSHWRKNDSSNLIVKLNKESEKSGFDYKIRISKTDKLTLFVFKGSFAKVVSKVVSDASDKNKYLVEIDPKEDCDILKKIVFSVTALADAGKRNGKKNENAFKFGSGVELYNYFAKNKKNVSAVDKHTCVP